MFSLFLLFLQLCSTSQSEVTKADQSFLRTPIQSNTGLPLSIVILSNPVLKPLCISRTSVNDLPLLAHNICKSSMFNTYTSYSLINPSNVSIDSHDLQRSVIYCNQSPSYETSCSINNSTSPCQFLLSVECGSCHSHIHLTTNSSVILKSPLYPVLQPDMICQYDLELDEEVSADISIDIEDLSIAPPQFTTSHTGTGHCITSYLHILSGNSLNNLDSIAMLCGEARSEKFQLRQQNSLRIQLVTGSGIYARNQRGFSLTVHVSPPLAIMSMAGVGIIIAFVLGIFLVFGALVAGLVIFQKCKAQKRKRRPRRGVTWHGSAPRPGLSLHMERTEHITRQLGRVEEGIEPDMENVYGALEERVPVYNYRSAYTGNMGPRNLPTPPYPVSESEESGTSEPIAGAEANKIYESFNSSGSSRNSSIDHSATSHSDQASPLYLSQLLPPVPRRPSWTLQSPAAESEQVGSPLYLCFQGSGQGYATPACDRNVTVKLSEASLDVKSNSSKTRPDYGSTTDLYTSGTIFRNSAELPSQSSQAKPKTRQSLLSLSDTTRKVSKLLTRMSLSEQTGRLLRKVSQTREGNIGEECLISAEGEDEDHGEGDVFY